MVAEPPVQHEASPFEACWKDIFASGVDVLERSGVLDRARFGQFRRVVDSWRRRRRRNAGIRVHVAHFLGDNTGTVLTFWVVSYALGGRRAIYYSRVYE